MSDSEMQQKHMAPEEAPCTTKHANLTVLVEPTSVCNLACLYCYKGEKTATFMTNPIMESMFRKVLAYNESREIPCSFVWHGGEPSLIGVEFYEAVFAFLAKEFGDQTISHTMQTNGTLLTDPLLDLCAKHNVSLGVSLDGPARHHNLMRPFSDGRPTYDAVMDGLQRAAVRGIDVGILMSVTNDNKTYIGEMFDFCREHRFTFGLNPISSDLHSMHQGIEVTPENYLAACKEVFDLWFYQEDFSIQVNPGFGISRLILSKNRLSDCFMSENCQMHFISIGPEGDIYPCNRFYGVEDYRLGNIVVNDLETALNSRKRRYLMARNAEEIKQCRDCPIKNHCNGGCMHHAVVHHGSLYAPDHLCLVYQGLFEHATHRLREELALHDMNATTH